MILELLFHIAQTEAAKAITESAEYLADKSFRYWFLVALITLIVAGMIAIKWLLSQLTEQRLQNAALQTQLINYIVNDHVSSIAALNKNTHTQAEVARTLQSISVLLSRHGVHTPPPEHHDT